MYHPTYIIITQHTVTLMYVIKVNHHYMWLCDLVEYKILVWITPPINNITPPIQTDSEV